MVEKSLSVDNLFVFLLLLGAFAVPRELQQRVLLYGIVGALVLRGIFIASAPRRSPALDWTSWSSALILVAPRSRSSGTRSAATTRRSTSTRCAAYGSSAGSCR